MLYTSVSDKSIDERRSKNRSESCNRERRKENKEWGEGGQRKENREQRAESREGGTYEASAPLASISQ
jgi:chromatin remodeling complex protein RSC6